MPRGRHRQSSQLAKLAPALVCAVLALAALGAALLSSNAFVLRVLVAALAVGTLAAMALLRQRSRATEAALAAESAARAREENRFEERAAELEAAAEAAEEQVKRLERRVLAQRSQLAHAEAENGRLLKDRARSVTEQALREAEAAQRREAEKRGVRPTPAAYLRAANALRALEVQAEPVVPRQAAVPPARQLPEPAREVTPRPVEAVAEAEPATPAAAKATPAAAKAAPAVTKAGLPTRASAASGPAWARAALPPLRPASAVPPVREARTGATASGTFNFFQRQESAIATKLGDLADPVGDEAAAAQDRFTQDEAPADAPAPVSAATEPAPTHSPVIDLTAEDETEAMDLRALRAL